MKTPNEKLVEFIYRKAELIETLIGVPGFFTKEDEKELMSWDESVAKDIVNVIVNTSLEWDRKWCPWCIKNNSCNECQYAVRHGNCTDELDSIYREVLIKINPLETTSIIETLGEKKEELREILLDESKKK